MRWLDTAKRWAGRIRTDIVALWLGSRDPCTPLLAKAIAASVAAYCLSPIDLIPDFIPVLGYLDDLLIVQLGILLAVRLVPRSLLVGFRSLAISHLPPARSGMGLVPLRVG